MTSHRRSNSPRPALASDRRVGVGMALSVALLVLMSILFPSIASAHSESGTLTVTKFEQTGPNKVNLEVGLVYDGDGHLAEDATVSVTLTSPAGEAIGPVALERVSGDSSLYGAEIDVTGEGTWVAEITSTDPAAKTNATVNVTAESTTTTAASPTSTSPTSTSPASTSPASTTPESAIDAAPEADSDDSDNTGLYIAIAAAAVIILGGIGFLVARRKPDAPTDIPD